MSRLALRPPTLLDVSWRARDGAQAFDPALREFLDEFYTHASRREAAVAEAPLLRDDVKDAYLAAVAEHLTQQYGLRYLPGRRNTGGR